LQSRMRDHAKDFRSNYSVIIEQGFAWSDEAPIDRSSIKGRGTGCNTLLEDFDYLVVRSDGNLYQCVFFMTDGEPIGNILDEKLERSLQYALHERRYQAFTEPKDRCVTCTNQAECGTGCRGYAQLYKQDWLKTDPRCAKDAPDAKTPAYFPVCPIMKQNVRSREIGGSTEEALARGLNSAVRTTP